MSSDDGSHSPDSTASISSNTEYESDFIEYLSSSDDEESNNLLFQDELEEKQERKRKRNMMKYKQMCEIDEETPKQKKRSPHKPILEQANKREPETTDDTASIDVKVKDMVKKANVFTCNINVPKSAEVVIINLKKRDKQNTKIVCNLNKPKLLHQLDTEIIVSSN